MSALVAASLLAQHAAILAAATTSVGHVQAIILGLLQGVAELFPISSLGHTVIAPKLLGWNIDQKSDTFLPFVVMLHLGTATALIVYFWSDWVSVVTPMVDSVRRGRLGESAEERIGWLVCAGTVPPSIIAVFFEQRVKDFFADPKIAAAFLVINGFLMYFGERLRARASRLVAQAEQGTNRPPAVPRPISTLSWTEAVIVGSAQALALVPGISRSGVTMVAGLATGLTHEAAARFAFLLATPLIIAAGVAEIPALLSSSGRSTLGDALLGGVVAAFAAYGSVRFLMRYFKVGRLTPFAYYCWAAGCLALVGLALRG